MRRNYFERFSLLGDPHRASTRRRMASSSSARRWAGRCERDRLFYFASIERQQVDASNFVTIDDETNVAHPFQPDVPLGTPADILRAAGFSLDTGHVPYGDPVDPVVRRRSISTSGASQRLSVRVNGAVRAEREYRAVRWAGRAQPRCGARQHGRHGGGDAQLRRRRSRLVNEARFLVARRDQLVLGTRSDVRRDPAIAKTRADRRSRWPGSPASGGSVSRRRRATTSAISSSTRSAIAGAST